MSQGMNGNLNQEESMAGNYYQVRDNLEGIRIND
jgi:hypothetical protein